MFKIVVVLLILVSSNAFCGTDKYVQHVDAQNKNHSNTDDDSQNSSSCEDDICSFYDEAYDEAFEELTDDFFGEENDDEQQEIFVVESKYERNSSNSFPIGEIEFVSDKTNAKLIRRIESLTYGNELNRSNPSSHKSVNLELYKSRSEHLKSRSALSKKKPTLDRSDSDLKIISNHLRSLKQGKTLNRSNPSNHKRVQRVPAIK